MIAAILELILGFFGEVFIEVVVELLFEGVLYGIANKINFKTREFAVVIEAAGYGLVGAMLGVITIFALPSSFIDVPGMRIANLVFSPLIAGAAMVGMGALRRKRGQNPIRFDSFLNGASFGLGLTIVRFFFV